MVRLKHRYLLVNILYPLPVSSVSIGPDSGSRNSNNKGTNGVIYKNHEDTLAHLRIHRPTPDWLTPQIVARMVRDAVGEVFGDWGMGKVGGAGGGRIQGQLIIMSQYFTVAILVVS